MRKDLSPDQIHCAGDGLLRGGLAFGSIRQLIGAGLQRRLTVMHVLSPTGTPEEQQKVELRTMGKLRELLPGDSGEWCTLQYQVKTGDIAAAVIASAQGDKANLIILCARHRSTLADHLPRTKISAIIRGAHCPVLVVPAHCS